MIQNRKLIARFVYFMRPVGMDGPIKIGCSKRPVSRLTALAVWSPFPLEIIAVAAGDMSTEKLIHDHYAEERWHHEWFHASPRLLAAVTALKHGEPIERAMPFVFGRQAKEAA